MNYKTILFYNNGKSTAIQWKSKIKTKNKNCNFFVQICSKIVIYAMNYYNYFYIMKNQTNKQ